MEFELDEIAGLRVPEIAVLAIWRAKQDEGYPHPEHWDLLPFLEPMSQRTLRKHLKTLRERDLLTHPFERDVRP